MLLSKNKLHHIYLKIFQHSLFVPTLFHMSDRNYKVSRLSRAEQSKIPNKITETVGNDYLNKQPPNHI